MPKILARFRCPIKSMFQPFVVNPISSLSTIETGTSVQISISLNKAPAADVSINSITFSDPLEGTINKSSLIFTNLNWNTAQVITVTGVDDLVVDGDKIQLLPFPQAQALIWNLMG